MSPTNVSDLFSMQHLPAGSEELPDANHGNETLLPPSEADYPLVYRIVATILHALILVLGVAGNIVLIVVARRTKSLQTPTYCYLVSLAYADLLVLLSAVPEAIVFHHVGRRWLFGQAMCSLFIFVNFLGINAGSIRSIAINGLRRIVLNNILAFTVERYIAIVRSPLAAKYCTTERTRKTIMILWIVALLYCCPWLGLTEVKEDSLYPDAEQCDFRYSPELYMGLFALDFGLFYVIPLAVAVYVYGRIALVLCHSTKLFRPSPCGSIYAPSPRSPSQMNGPLLTPQEDWDRRLPARASRTGMTARMASNSRAQVLPMLVVTVFLFALAWLPFRGILIYNSIADEPWLDIWYLLMAKTLIYLNSALNPFIYNFMSRRFRRAVKKHFGGLLRCRFKRRNHLTLPPAFLSAPVSSVTDRHRGRSTNNSVPASGNSACYPVRATIRRLPHSRTAQF